MAESGSLLSIAGILFVHIPRRELFTNMGRQLLKGLRIVKYRMETEQLVVSANTMALGMSLPQRPLQPTTRLEQSSIGTLFSTLFCARY